MVLGNGEKVTILISALEARYTALDAIRERAQSVSIWSLGLLLGAAGWIVQSGKVFPGDQTAVICVSVLAAWVVLRLFLADLRRGFRAQQEVTATLEERLGLYAEGRFGPGSAPVFPAIWKKSGRKEGRGRYFQSTYAMLDVGLLIFLAAVLSRGEWVRAWSGVLLGSIKL